MNMDDNALENRENLY